MDSITNSIEFAAQRASTWSSIIPAIIAFLGAIVAAVISARSSRKAQEKMLSENKALEKMLTKQRIDADIAAKARIEWIQEVRKVVVELTLSYHQLFDIYDQFRNYINININFNQQDDPKTDSFATRLSKALQPCRKYTQLLILFFGPDGSSLSENEQVKLSHLYFLKFPENEEINASDKNCQYHIPQNKYVDNLNDFGKINLLEYRRDNEGKNAYIVTYLDRLFFCIGEMYKHSEANLIDKIAAKKEAQTIREKRKQSPSTPPNDVRAQILKLHEDKLIVFADEPDFHHTLHDLVDDLSNVFRLYLKIEWNRAKDGK